MRRITAAGLLALCACAPAATAGGAAGGAGEPMPTQVIATGDGMHVITTAETRMLTHDISAPVDRVWQVLPEVYRELELEGTASAATRTVSSPSLSFTRRILGEPATRFFDCGRGEFGMEIANTHTIHLTARTTVQPGATPAGSRLETTIQAFARSNTGANASMSQCRSTGVLEGLIALRVRERLAG
ncbi:MAG TPA: hypothetical protein VFR37_21030 [Longimicrobium sp.]|nr:hypothetical protein [Longimicrobium sp.]